MPSTAAIPPPDASSSSSSHSTSAGTKQKTSSTAPSATRPAHDEPLLDLGVFREVARRGLTDLLDEVPGSKVLVIDPSLAGPLGLITDVGLLKVRLNDLWIRCIAPDTTSTESWCGQDVLSGGRASVYDGDEEYRLSLSTERPLDEGHCS